MATRRGGSWRDGFLLAVERGELDAAIGVLDGEKSSHAGTPRQAVKLEAVRVIEGKFGASRAALYEAAMVFARSESGGAQEVGLVLLGKLYAHSPDGVTGTICGLADSENWEVREWAASALRRVISENFGAVYPTVEAWVGDSSPNVRRAALVASGSAAGSLTEEECRRLLEALTPLLEDDDPYVRKNMGAFAIGDGFLRAQPEMVAAWLGRASSQPRAQWNAAMALSAAEAANHFGLLSELLCRLAADERTVVRRAVYRAVISLAKRIPEEILPLLEAWKGDSERSHVCLQVEARLS